MGINELIAQGSTRVPAWNLFETERNSLVNQGLRQELQYRPENQNWLRKSREMEVEKFGLQKERAAQEKEAWAQEQEMRPIETDMKKRQYLSIVADWLDPDNYEQSRDHLIKVNKIPEQWLPKADYFKSDDPEFNNYAFRVWQNRVKSGAIAPIEKAKLGQKEREIGLRERELDIEEQKLTQPKEVAKTELGKIIDEMNSLAPNDPNRQLYAAKIQKLTQATGMQVTVDKDGTVRVTQGPLGAGGGGMTPTTKTDVQKKLFNATEQMSRLRLIEQKSKPEFQTLRTRGESWWLSVKEKLGKNLNPEEAALVSEFATYQQDALENINKYINEITGAQMSEQEADRLRKVMPDPGEGVWGKDSPTQFKAKLDNAIYKCKLSIVRYQMLLSKGFDPEAIKKMAGGDALPSLDKAKEYGNQLIQDRKKTLKESNPDLSDDIIRLRAIQEIGEEIGI